MKRAGNNISMADRAKALAQRNKAMRLYLEVSCKLCINYPCFEGIDNIESNLANTCLDFSVTKENNEQA